MENQVSRLYKDLKRVSSIENLNRITGKLIELYKNKSFPEIRFIAEQVSEFIPVKDEKDARCFSKLLMVYHPDKAEQIRKKLNELAKSNDLEGLQSFNHFFLWENMEKMIPVYADEDIGYEPEYVWDDSFSQGMRYTESEHDYSENPEPGYFEFDRSFYNLLKLREYGDLSIELPPYYLQDIEEIEMVLCDMESLDGIEFCHQVRVLDISDNFIPDIEKLWDLHLLEELYIANNQLYHLDVLSNLTRLRILDISGNHIDDITSLFELETLEFLNLTGNPVPRHQVDKLTSGGVLVMI